jgi:hypothetical protein
VQPLTDQGRQKINELAQRYQVSSDAVMTMLQAVVNGNGTMAQFYHQELGGGGQWMQGGMTMVGDMFNSGLKSKVDGLCTELSRLLAQQPFVAPGVSHQSQWQGGGYGAAAGSVESPVSLFVPGSTGGSGSWWPVELGSPNSSGGQNHVRYAYFANARRLAIEVNGVVTVYDTLDQQIGGVSQQQGGGGSFTLSSQFGTVDVANLPIISSNAEMLPASGHAYTQSPPPWNSPSIETAQENDIFVKIERLADLLKKGILSQDEFSTKKSELLSRL